MKGKSKKPGKGYAMGGPVMPMMPAPGAMPAGMPAQANMGGAMRGLDRATAMSGRTFKKGGMVRGMGAAKKGGSFSGCY